MTRSATGRRGRDAMPGKRKRQQPSSPPASETRARGSRAASGAQGRASWVLSGALLLAVAVMLWPVLGHGPLRLDDAGLLAELADAPLSAVMGRDHFGHLRPGKNLLLWWAAQQQQDLTAVRAGVLLVFLLSMVAIQRLASDLLGSRWWGLLAVACFALNPTTVSVLAWLSAANYAVCLLFVLGFVQLTRAALSGDADGRGSWRLEAIAGVLLLCAVLQHELALLAPWLVIALPGAREAWARNRRSLAVLLGAWALSLLLVVGLRAASTGPDIVYRLAAHPPGALLQSAARYALLDLRLWVFQQGAFGVLFTDAPGTRLAFDALAWLGLLALVALALRTSRVDPVARLAWVWLAIFLLPVTNLLPLGMTPVGAHYLYLPGVGLSLLVARGAQRLSQAMRAHALGAASHAPATALLVLCALWLPEHQRTVSAFGDEAALLRATLKNHPGNIEVAANLVAVYLDRDELEAAARLLERSLRRAPHDPILVANNFELLWRTGPPDAALSFLDAHPELRGDGYDYRRGVLLTDLGRGAEAIPLYRRVAERTSDPELRRMAGAKYAKAQIDAGRYAEALRMVELLRSHLPGDPELKVLHGMLRDRVLPTNGTPPHR